MGIDALHDLAIELQHQTQHAVRRRMLRPEIDGEIAQRGLSHHALTLVFCAFSTTRALNLSHATT